MEQWLLIGIATAIAGILGFILARSSLKLHWKMALLMVVWVGFLMIIQPFQEKILYKFASLEGLIGGILFASIPFMLIGICGSAYMERYSMKLNKVLIGGLIFAIAALILGGMMRPIRYPDDITAAVLLCIGFLFLVPATFLVLSEDTVKKGRGMALAAIGTIFLLLIWTIKSV